MHYRCDFKFNIDGGKQIQETLHIGEHIGTIRRNKHYKINPGLSKDSLYRVSLAYKHAS